MLDLQNTSVQAILRLADSLGAPPSIKYRGLCQLADEFLPSPTASLKFTFDSKAAWVGLAGSALYSTWISQQPCSLEDRAKLLSKVLKGCQSLLVSEDGSIDEEQLRKGLRILENYSAHFASKHVRVVSDDIEEIYRGLLRVGDESIADHLSMGDCHHLLDVLYSNLKFRGGLKNGGQLLAAGMVAAACIVFVPQQKLKRLPILVWVGEQSNTSTNVVRAQVLSILNDIF